MLANLKKQSAAVEKEIRLFKDQRQSKLDAINEKFGNWEKIKRFELTPEIWSTESGHLTPTMKLKRKVVLEKYKNLFEKIYGLS